MADYKHNIDDFLVVDWADLREAIKDEFLKTTDYEIRVMEGQTGRDGNLIVTTSEGQRSWFTLSYSEGEITLKERNSSKEQDCTFLFEIVEFVQACLD